MGVYFSLSRIKKDDSYLKDINQYFITVDYDLKENFFVEYIDTLMPTSNGIGRLLRNEEVLNKLTLTEKDFLFFTKAGDFMEGDNVDIFVDPNNVTKTIEILQNHKDILIDEKIFVESELINLTVCKDFLNKAIVEDNYVQFYWQ